jgi:dodecin
MSVYRVTEVIGTSSTSWEDAAAEAIRIAAGTIRDLRVAEVVKQDIHLEDGGGSPIVRSCSSRSSTSRNADPVGIYSARRMRPGRDGIRWRCGGPADTGSAGGRLPLHHAREPAAFIFPLG